MTERVAANPVAANDRRAWSSPETAERVYRELTAAMAADNTVTVSMREIATRLDIGRNTVAAAINRLVGVNRVTVRRLGSGDRYPTNYAVLVDPGDRPGAASADGPPDNAADGPPDEQPDSGVSATMDVERLLSPEELARELQVTARTLGDWRSHGRGPAWIALTNKVVRYRPTDVRAWLEERARRQGVDARARGRTP